MITKRIIFEGHVHGVGFCHTTHHIAYGFDVVGWVKYLHDDTVELVVEGANQVVIEFMKKITEESTLAHYIDSYTSEDIAPLGMFEGFKIEKEF